MAHGILLHQKKKWKNPENEASIVHNDDLIKENNKK